MKLALFDHHLFEYQLMRMEILFIRAQIQRLLKNAIPVKAEKPDYEYLRLRQRITDDHDFDVANRQLSDHELQRWDIRDEKIVPITDGTKTSVYRYVKLRREKNTLTTVLETMRRFDTDIYEKATNVYKRTFDSLNNPFPPGIRED